MLLAGNEHIKSLTAAMIKKGREPHSLMITGEHGQGRKTAAKYIASAMRPLSGSESAVQSVNLGAHTSGVRHDCAR